MGTQTVVNDTAGQNGMKFFSRLTSIIFSPADVMKDLINRPRTFFAIFMITFTIPLYLLIRFPLFARLVINQAQQNFSDPYIENYLGQLEVLSWTYVIATMILLPVILLVSWLAGTFILFLITRYLLKAEGTYKQILSITGYSYVIILFSHLIHLGSSFMTDELFLDASLANILRLAAPNLIGSEIYGFLRGIDIFSIWQYAVIGIGITCLGNIDRKKLIPALCILYIINVWLNSGIYVMI